jgi:hypothetical protein
LLTASELRVPRLRVQPDAFAVVSVSIVLGAVLLAVLARPAVSTFDIQRRDRLAPAARFVPFAYEFLLNRAPDPAGLATYQRTFEEQGPEAVAAALVTSQEFRDKSERNPGGRSLDQTDDTDSIAKGVVSAYQADLSAQLSPSDSMGRVAFVCLILACLLAVGWLRHAARSASTSADARIYVPTRYITGLFGVLALMAWTSSDLLLGSFGRSSRFVYVEWLAQVTALAAARGPTNIWTPYPQGLQDLIVGLGVVANAVASSIGSDIWTNFSVFRILYQFVFLLVPSILTVAVVGMLGRQISSSTAALAALGAAFSIAPMYYGFLAAYVTDPLPVLLTLVAVWLLATQRNGLAGVAIGVGAVLKLFPLLLLPVALVFVRTWKTRVRITLATILVMVAVFVPPALSNIDMFLSPIRWQTGRPAWESWYAFANWVVSAPHEFHAPYFVDSSVGDAFGWVFWGITPRISALISPVPASSSWGWESSVSLAGTLVILLMCFTARERSILSLVRWSLFSLAGFLFWGVGWSPQYELYVVPLVLLALRPPIVGLVTALLLEGLTLLEYPVLLPWAYFYGGAVVWIMWAALLGRYIVLAWLCVYVIQAESSLGALVGRLLKLRGFVLAVATRLRPAAAVLLVAVLLVASVPASAGFSAQAPGSGTCGTPRARLQARLPDPGASDVDWPLAGGHFFSQTASMPSAGFAILDDDKASFWTEFQRLGGSAVLGYPATRRFTWHSLLSQATQRAILQWSPVTRQVDFANVLDLLHEDGMDDALVQHYQIPLPAEVDEAGLPYETIAERRLAWLDERPSIKKAYCDAPGGADPLVLWGLPTSMAINMANPGTAYVVRTQRAAFQEWVDGAPWAAPGDVTVVLAGDLAKDFRLLPPDAVVPEFASAH